MNKKEVDIISIDAAIRNKFQQAIEELPDKRRRLNELKRTRQNRSIPITIKRELDRNIKSLSREIINVSDRIQFNRYIILSSEYLQRYRRMLNIPVKVSFAGKRANSNTEKEQLIHDYINLAQRYIDITVPTTSPTGIVCEGCGRRKYFEIHDENQYICTKCGAQHEIDNYIVSYKDAGRVNTTSKYTYDRKIHFQDGMNQYQGKQNCTIEKKVYDGLIDQFDRHHLLVGDENTPKKIRFGNIEKLHIFLFLKELGFTKHYENVNLIHYTITGKKPDDISHLEDRLLEDFDDLVEVYDRKYRDKIDRKSFINTHQVLYALLCKHRHPCRKEDFTVLKTIERKSFHDTIMKNLFMDLGWPYQDCYF